MKAEDLADKTGGSEPKVLYHYTTVSGLLGILRDGNIWATNISYLNDRKELKDGLEILETRIGKFDEQLGHRRAIRLSADPISPGEELYDAIEVLAIFSQQAYVCSFSAQPDQLSQWRAYCPNGVGFSIGFNRSKLQSKIPGEASVLKECIYEKEKKEAEVDRIIRLFFERNNPKSKEEFFRNRTMALMQGLPCFKDASFHEEKEWRIVIWVRNEKGLKFREGNSMVIPYIDFGLRDEKGDLPIDSIVIGPTPNPKESRWSLGLLLEHYGISKEIISESKIPFRGGL